MIAQAGWEHVVRLFRWERRLLARFVATTIGRAAASMAVMLLIKEFLSGALGAGGGEPSAFVRAVNDALGPAASLWAVAALVLGAYVTGALMNYDNQVAQQRIVQVIEMGLMERLIRHLLSLSVPFFDRQSHGDIVQAIRMDVTQLRMVVIGIANIFLEGFLAAGLVAAAIWLSPWLALWGLLVLPLAMLPILVIAKRTLERSYRVRRTGFVLFDVVLQVLGGIRVIKAYGLERRQAAAAVAKGRAFFDQVIEMVRTRSLSQVVLESMAGLGVVVVIVIGGLQITRGALGWPELVAFIMALRTLQGPLNNLHMHFVQVQTNGASVTRIAELFRARPEVCDRPGAAPLREPPRAIAFERVTFAYGERPVIEDVSFVVPAGSTIGVVGPSGAGKSTLLSLIVRFYDPTSGRVLFDGRDLREFRLRDIYAKIAIVMQEPFLFAATVRENIRCARPGASDGEVESAARAAFIHEGIVALPGGYETPIGTGGQGLSGGQRQRINVARALLKDAPILLLDEATSALDSVAEAEVQRAIDRLMRGRTTFVIAHRLSTLRNAGRILVMDKGRVAGFGTHDELIATCPVYREICDAQRLGGGRRRVAA